MLEEINIYAWGHCLKSITVTLTLRLLSSYELLHCYAEQIIAVSALCKKKKKWRKRVVFLT
jgi:hypothetical protein